MSEKDAAFNAFAEAGLIEEMTPREVVIVGMMLEPSVRDKVRSDDDFDWTGILPAGLDPKLVNAKVNPDVIDPLWSPTPGSDDGPPSLDPLIYPTTSYPDWRKRISSVPDNIWDDYRSKFINQYEQGIAAAASPDISPEAVLGAFVAGMAVGYAAYAYAAKY